MATMSLDVRALRVALATVGWPAWKLAARLEISASALSQYCHGRRPMPVEVMRRAELVLGLSPGALELPRDTEKVGGA